MNLNKPDALGIRYVNSQPTALVFIEVKSNVESLYGDSGLGKHIKCMKKYFELYPELIKIRLKEAEDIMNEYKELDIRKVPENFTGLNELNLSKEILIIATDKIVKEKCDEIVHEIYSKDELKCNVVYWEDYLKTYN